MSINQDKFKAFVTQYKNEFERVNREERYKWEAVKHFKEHWDIEAADFREMLTAALGKTGNLLAAAYFLPRKMIILFAEKEPETVREMFRQLFKEDQPLIRRIEAFIAEAESLRRIYGDDSMKQHFQNTNAISTYLCLNYPQKYYIYKYSTCRNCARKLDYPHKPKKGVVQSVQICYDFYEEMRTYLMADAELIALSKARLDTSCNPDEALRILTADVAYFISREELLPAVQAVFWKISHGNGLFSDQERQLFAEQKIIVVHKDTQAKASSKQSQGECFMSEIKENDYFYLCYGNEVQLLGQIDGNEVAPCEIKGDGWYQRSYKMIAKAANATPYTGQKKWWTPNENSTCIQIRPEEWPLFEQKILWPYFKTTIQALIGGAAIKGNFWWLNADPDIWRFADLDLGEEKAYSLTNDNGNKRKVQQNFLDAQVGDWVIGYESTPVKQVTALLCVSKASDGDSISFEKMESFQQPIDYAVLSEIAELRKMENVKKIMRGTLFKLTDEQFAVIMRVIREINPAVWQHAAEYSTANFLAEVYMAAEEYEALRNLLLHKKNIILQGAPGVGKTFAAKRLAYSMLGCKDEDKIKMVQFHQNYAYEDFVLGYRPDKEGFTLQHGVFYEFCTLAKSHPENQYFFIIDEINRGNLSKVFGEILMLIEKDYRGEQLALTYNDNNEPFAVPENIYLIGMMNTADRSLAMIDYALRRRFSFFSMAPAFDSDGFKAYQDRLQNDIFDELITTVKQLNLVISSDPSLGDGFCIGHSYFCEQKVCTEEWISEVIEYDLIPMLQEYWFDESSKVQEWSERLRSVLYD